MYQNATSQLISHYPILSISPGWSSSTMSSSRSTSAWDRATWPSWPDRCDLLWPTPHRPRSGARSTQGLLKHPRCQSHSSQMAHMMHIGMDWDWFSIVQFCSLGVGETMGNCTGDFTRSRHPTPPLGSCGACSKYLPVAGRIHWCYLDGLRMG